MLQVPAVPEVSTCAHPVLLSKPLEKSVVGVVPQEAVKVGAEQVSQMFVRPKKSREELMREEDEEERRR